MSAKSRKRPFQIYEGLFEEDRHIRKTHFLLHHPNYIDLSANAKVLYDYMLDWAGGNKAFVFSASLADKLMTKPTFIKSRNELAELGFIEFINAQNAKYLRQSGRFEFSNSWITKNNPHCSVREYNSTYRSKP